MILDRVELRRRFLNRVAYVLFARVQIVAGISSRVGGDWEKHRVLWDLDSCGYEQAIKSLSDVQARYGLGRIYIISDKERSYGAVCNNVVSFRDLIHILLDTDLIDPLFVRYALQRHEAILRLSDKENRPIHREIITELHAPSDRPYDEREFTTVEYETGYIKEGIRSGNFANDQRGFSP